MKPWENLLTSIRPVERKIEAGSWRTTSAQPITVNVVNVIGGSATVNFSRDTGDTIAFYPNECEEVSEFFALLAAQLRATV